MSRYLVTAFVLMTSLSVVASAHVRKLRGCEECPVPMHEWSGNWWNDDAGLKLEIDKWGNGSRYVSVTLRDTASGLVVASGIGYSPTDSVSMDIHMQRHDGVKFSATFTLEQEFARIHAAIPEWIGNTLNGQNVPPDLYFQD